MGAVNDRIHYEFNVTPVGVYGPGPGDSDQRSKDFLKRLVLKTY